GHAGPRLLWCEASPREEANAPQSAREGTALRAARAGLLAPARSQAPRGALAPRLRAVLEAPARRRGDRVVRQERAHLGARADLALLPAPLRAPLGAAPRLRQPAPQGSPDPAHLPDPRQLHPGLQRQPRQQARLLRQARGPAGAEPPGRRRLPVLPVEV